MCVVRQSAPILGPKRPKIWKKWGPKNHIFANEAIFFALSRATMFWEVVFRPIPVRIQKRSSKKDESGATNGNLKI